MPSRHPGDTGRGSAPRAGRGAEDVVATLYEEYFLDAAGPRPEVSSHWQALLGQSRIGVKAGEVAELAGAGFGTMSHLSVLDKLSSMMTIAGYLVALPRRAELARQIPAGRAVARRMGLWFSYDCFRQLCTLSCLREYGLPEKPNVLIIGDGYGYLAGLIKASVPGSRVCLVDLGETLLFQAAHLARAFPRLTHQLVRGNTPAGDFMFCPADELDRLSSHRFDVAVNVASMQEMHPDVIASYFRLLRTTLRPRNLFYCCNRLEKRMPGGEVARFFEYPWSEDDEIHLDELCPWHRFFVAARPTKRGPRLAGVRVPLINFFDGEHHHRLLTLSG